VSEMPPVWLVKWATKISLRRKYIYLDNPKVASSFIKSALLQAEVRDGTLPDRPGADDIHGTGFWDTQYDLRHANCFVFSFVRNPFARILSCYLDKISTANGPPGHIGTRKCFCSDYAIPYETEISFTAFLEAISNSDPETENAHWGAQSRNLLSGSLAIDSIGNVEHMEEDVRHILLRAGADIRKSRGQEHATDAGTKLEQYYGPAERELVIRKYEQDFDRFGYSRDLSDLMPRYRRLSLPRTNMAGFRLARAVGLENLKPNVAAKLCRKLVNAHKSLLPYEILLRINRRSDPAVAAELVSELLTRDKLPAAVWREVKATLLARDVEGARACVSHAMADNPNAPHLHSLMASIQRARWATTTG
jgi:hypothetical protein